MHGSAVNVFSFPQDFLDNTPFSLADFTVGIQYIIDVMYKICVYQLLLFSVKILVCRRLFVVKVWAVRS